MTLWCNQHYISEMKRTPNKELTLQIRLTEAEKAGFSEAAQVAGVGLSTWARERLRVAAIRELEGAGRRVPFVPPVPLRSVSNG